MDVKEIWRRFQKHMGYTDEEMKVFRSPERFIFFLRPKNIIPFLKSSVSIRKNSTEVAGPFRQLALTCKTGFWRLNLWIPGNEL